MVLLLRLDSGGGAKGYHWRGHGPTAPEPMPSACAMADDRAAWLKYPFEYVAMAGTCQLTLEPCAKGQSRGVAAYMHWCAAALRNASAFGCGKAMAEASSTAAAAAAARAAHVRERLASGR